MLKLLSAAVLAALLFAAPAEAAQGDGGCVYARVGQDKWALIKARYPDPLEGLGHLREFVSEDEWNAAVKRCVGADATQARQDVASAAASGYAMETQSEALLIAAGFTHAQLDAAYRRRDPQVLAAVARSLVDSTEPPPEAQDELVAFVKDLTGGGPDDPRYRPLGTYLIGRATREAYE
jgi:hypothetical protein